MRFGKTSILPVLAAGLAMQAMAARVPPPAEDLPSPGEGKVATAVLAGGCFWGVEAVFERLKGVIAVAAGYAGGKAADANYAKVGTERTGHAESVQITYNPALITYGQLLQVFFSVAHDPTQVDHQGPDYGPSYRSVIFYSSDAQKRVAQAYIAQLNKAHVFQAPIATQVSLLPGFFPAEEHHQHYLDRNPNDPYIVANDMPKLHELEVQFPDLLKPKQP